MVHIADAHYVVLSVRSERPEDWVPEEDASSVYNDNRDDISEDIVDIFSVHSYHNAGMHFLVFRT